MGEGLGPAFLSAFDLLLSGCLLLLSGCLFLSRYQALFPKAGPFNSGPSGFSVGPEQRVTSP